MSEFTSSFSWTERRRYYNGGQWKRVGDIDLQGIMHQFQKTPRAKIKLEIMRAGVKFKYKFILKALL